MGIDGGLRAVVSRITRLYRGRDLVDETVAYADRMKYIDSIRHRTSAFIEMVVKCSEKSNLSQNKCNILQKSLVLSPQDVN